MHSSHQGFISQSPMPIFTKQDAPATPLLPLPCNAKSLGYACVMREDKVTGLMLSNKLSRHWRTSCSRRRAQAAGRTCWRRRWISLSAGEQALGEPDVDQRLHWLHLLVADQVEQPANVHEVNEARVELLVGVEVPEGVEPVPVVEVGIASHHLAVDTTNVRFKTLGKARSLA